MRDTGSYCVSRTRPASMTKTTSSMVMDVSAMLVAMTTFRTPRGGLEKVRRCSSDDSVECRGMSKNRRSTSSRVPSRRSCSPRISAMPGRKIKMAPSSYSSAMSATRSSMSSKLIFSSSTVCRHLSVVSAYPGYIARVSSVTSPQSCVRCRDSSVAARAAAPRAPPPESAPNTRPPRPPREGSAPSANSLSGSHTYPVASMASSRRYSATGNVRPGISTHPHDPGTTFSKYDWNSSALTVADMATSLKSSLRAANRRRITSKKSESKSRSCTSSTMT